MNSTKHISTSGYMKLILSLALSITTSMTAVGIAHELYKKWVQSQIKQKDQIYISVLLLLGEVYIMYKTIRRLLLTIVHFRNK